MHQNVLRNNEYQDLNSLLPEFDSSELDILKRKKAILDAEASLHEFFKQAWPYIEGRMPYVDSWYIESIAKHLEAVYKRQIKKLIINVPPRTGKTNLISIAFPAWVWIRNPCERFLTVSCVNSLQQIQI